MKTCFKCGIQKESREFYTHPDTADGHLGKCKECARLDSRERGKKKKCYIRAFDKERSIRPERKKSKQGYNRNYTLKYPYKRKAHQILGNAVRDGKIIKPLKCSKCGGKNKIEGHHEDYSKPLDVVWLCMKCHRARHRELEALFT